MLRAIFKVFQYLIRDFLGDSAIKNLPAGLGDMGDTCKSLGQKDPPTRNSNPLQYSWGFRSRSVKENQPAMQGMLVPSLVREDPLEEGMAISWTEEPGELYSP